MKLHIRSKLFIAFSVFIFFSLIVQILSFYTVKIYVPNFHIIEGFYLFMIVPSGILFLVAFVMSKNLTNAIRRLQQSVNNIEKGQLDTNIIIKSGDEIEMLSHSFDSLVKQLLQREASLKKEKQETDIMLQSLTDGVVALDQNHTIIMFNKAAEKFTGFNAQLVWGKNADDILHFYEGVEIVAFEKYSDQSESNVKRLRDKGITIVNNEGAKIKLSLTTAPIISGDQQTGYIIAFHDLSKEYELEEMKLDFVSMAAHELRTPLTAIRGYASLLEMQHIDTLDDSAKELIHRLQISSETLGGLIDNLLSVSRIERNMFSVELKPVDIIKTLREVVDNIRQTAETKQQTLNFSMPTELPVVMADSFRIGQVLSNLVANAINYSKEGSIINVLVEKKDGYLQISVSDNGNGIPKEALNKLFTKFFRVSGALEQGSKGTGLGLFISKSIIVMHNGKIWADSELGKGSTFAFNLPIAGPEKIAEYVKKAEQASLTVKNGQGIIIKNTHN